MIRVSKALAYIRAEQDAYYQGDQAYNILGLCGRVPYLEKPRPASLFMVLNAHHVYMYSHCTLCINFAIYKSHLLKSMNIAPEGFRVVVPFPNIFGRRELKGVKQLGHREPALGFFFPLLVKIFEYVRSKLSVVHIGIVTSEVACVK